MSTSQVQNFKRLKSILGALRHFGLNPRDWRIDRDALNASGKFGIHNRVDPDFRMRGKWCQKPDGRIYLNELALASL